MHFLQHLFKKAQSLHKPPGNVFLKQYGERRTGTNFLRTILASNYFNVVPLMHILGDKHSPPVDFNACLKRARLLPNPDWEFVRSATLATPAESTESENSEQWDYLRTIASPLTASVKEGRLGFIISLKHPYPWIVSFAKYSGWIEGVNERWQMNVTGEDQLEAACREYNNRHKAWLDLYLQNSARSFLVRHEDLLKNPRRVMSDLEDKFDLRRRQWHLDFPEKKVAASHWDQDAPFFNDQPFDSNYYHLKKYEEVLTREQWDRVTHTIDWNLLAKVGYEKTPLTTTFDN